jgi:hypothetical protein
MDRVYLRHSFENSKSFLKQLYQSENSAQTLNNATEDNLNVLIKILHLVCVKEIKLHKTHADQLVKSKRLKRLQLFQSKAYFQKLLKESRATKLGILKQFLSLYNVILFGFFNDF